MPQEALTVAPDTPFTAPSSLVVAETGVLPSAALEAAARSVRTIARISVILKRPATVNGNGSGVEVSGVVGWERPAVVRDPSTARLARFLARESDK